MGQDENGYSKIWFDAYVVFFSFHFISFYWLIQVYNLFSHCPQIAKASLGGHCQNKTKYALHVVFTAIDRLDKSYLNKLDNW